ncbi:hypothetical protein QR680_009574 [Steinernema hermaphroditum]|uniref:Mothers against decapentaplegic homolog n=1 Tax=Steinernema hermaphroditum TaxID=289476 RepID=A0AA39M947_9BILA|nr:hypothetical protein QR680_009574 [Steinernema hermaphroditum]
MDFDGRTGDSPPGDANGQRHRSGSCTALTLKQLSLNVNPNYPPNGGEPCGTLVAFLKHFHVGGDEEFTIKALESLIKKLKDKRNELDILLRVVAKRGDCPEAAECVTIPRTLDGRLQVAGRKGFPHVVYAKIWRWPDLHKNELKNVPHCTSAFDMKTESVCINPYHYERIESPPGGLGFDLPSAVGPAVVLQQQFDVPLPSSSGLEAADLEAMLRSDTQLGPAANPFAQLSLDTLRTLAFQTNLGSLNLNSAATLLSNPLFAQTFFSPTPQTPLLPLAAETLQGVVPLQSPLLEEAVSLEDGHETDSELGSQVWCRVQYHERDTSVGEAFDGLCRKLLLRTSPGDHSTFDISKIPNEERTEEASKARSYLDGADIVVKRRDDGKNMTISVRSSIANLPIYVRSCHLHRQVQREASEHGYHSIFPDSEIQVPYPSPSSPTHLQVYDTSEVLSGLSACFLDEDEEKRAATPRENGHMPKPTEGEDSEEASESRPPSTSSTHSLLSNESVRSASSQPARKKPKTEDSRHRIDYEVLKELTRFQLALPQSGQSPKRIEDFECWFEFRLCRCAITVFPSEYGGFSVERCIDRYLQN